jgi:transcription elongation GreA/GreB family factor
MKGIMNSKDPLRILKIDLDWIDQRVIELDKLILNLSDEFREAFTQSSETWHDNAMFDNVREKQNVLSAEQQGLWSIRKRVYVVEPQVGNSEFVVIGSRLSLVSGEERLVLEIGGDYIAPSISSPETSRRISAASPIGLKLLGAAVGDELEIGQKVYTLVQIEAAEARAE